MLRFNLWPAFAQRDWFEKNANDLNIISCFSNCATLRNANVIMQALKSWKVFPEVKERFAENLNKLSLKELSSIQQVLYDNSKRENVCDVIALVAETKRHYCNMNINELLQNKKIIKEIFANDSLDIIDVRLLCYFSDCATLREVNVIMQALKSWKVVPGFKKMLAENLNKLSLEELSSIKQVLHDNSERKNVFDVITLVVETKGDYCNMNINKLLQNEKIVKEIFDNDFLDIIDVRLLYDLFFAKGDAEKKFLIEKIKFIKENPTRFLNVDKGIFYDLLLAIFGEQSDEKFNKIIEAGFEEELVLLLSAVDCFKDKEKKQELKQNDLIAKIRHERFFNEREYNKNLRPAIWESIQEVCNTTR